MCMLLTRNLRGLCRLLFEPDDCRSVADLTHVSYVQNYIQIGRVMLWDACESSYEEHTLDATLKAGRGSFGQV